MSYISNLAEIGAGIIGRAVTETLYVSPEGSGTNGHTWAGAYTTIQAALAAASTDADDCTLILISPHTSNYDIDTTGDPTFTGNYILMGSYRNWTKILNTHASATSILKFTGKVALVDLNFNLGSGSGNGIIMTHGGFRVYNCMFVGEDLTGAATALHFDGASEIKHGKVIDCDFLGEGTTHMTGIVVDNCSRSVFERLRMHECKTCIQVVENAGTSDQNLFHFLDLGDSGIGLDLDAGDEQHFQTVLMHHMTTNIDDEVGNHVYHDMRVVTPMAFLPDDFTGVDLDTDAVADTWGANTEILAAAGRTEPFRVVGLSLEADANEKFRVRLSADGGTTHFVDFQFEGEAAAARRESIQLPSGTDEIFNYNTQISGSAKSESGGDTATIWLEIQEI